MKRLVAILTALLFFSSISNAQKAARVQQVTDKPFVLGRVDELWSSQLSEKRVLNIYLPDGYNADSNKNKDYPVVYLLDGSANEDFVHICGVVQFLTMIEAMPPTVVVGIANVDRKRDFTFPTSVKEDKIAYPTTGGSEKFILFVEKELQPFVQKKYRVASRTIIGQSLGGLLATEILLKKPWLFDNYIIVSPSLWWDKESLLARTAAMISSLNTRKITVYLSVGAEEKVMVDDANELAGMLQQQANANLKVSVCPMPEENHLTILHNSVYKAFIKLNSKK